MRRLDSGYWTIKSRLIRCYTVTIAPGFTGAGGVESNFNWVDISLRPFGPEYVTDVELGVRVGLGFR